ncbi:MFS transporter [Streptomyces sp. WAC 06738]|uniref:MFS transporter n=1 Tax=Streptomyces sp. WAC 06738 TaxID=2203210 RepID=UPI001F0C4B4E|nr:MFS transporter [Streptomyces sp. WAC 06738]
MATVSRRRRLSLSLMFLIPGLSLSSWVTRTPDVRDELGASTAEMGLILFGLSVGSTIGIASSGALVARMGTRPVIGGGTVLIALGVAGVGTGALASSAALVTTGLFVFGLGGGSGEVALNVEGAEVERLLGRSVMTALHGFFSLGTVLGASLGMLATAAGFPVQWHLIIMSGVALAVFLASFGDIPGGVGKPTAAAEADAAEASEGAAGGRPLWQDTRLLLIGAVVLAMALAEGAATDWLPLLMVDGHDLDAALGSLVYVGFATAMTVGRFCGGFFIDRFGRYLVIRTSAISAALGLVVVIFVDHPVAAGAAVLFWGLGASLGFPVAISAAGDSGPNPTARVSMVAMIAYAAFLVGPPGLGFLGDHYGLRSAMIAVLALVATAIFLAPAVGERRPAVADVKNAPGAAPRREKEPVDDAACADRDR